MYQDYFGFKEMPFNVTPDPKFLYLSPTHEEALSHLLYGVQQKKGFIVLTGEVGCGKTTLCRALLNQLNKNEVDTALILNSRVHEKQLLRDMLKEYGIPTEGKPEEDYVEKINQHLLKRTAEGKNVVLIVDEAQNLSFDVLEQIRLLSNLETDTQKLLQIILIGQPELKDKLHQKNLRQLKQRILVHYELKPLSRDETRKYINHRIAFADGKGRGDFSYWAIRKVFRHSQGIPRLINNICDKSLLSAFTNSSNKVSYRDVRRAVRELQIA